MQINPVKNCNNYNKNIAFNGQHLYSLNLLRTLSDGTKEKVPAIFTKLVEKNTEDLNIIENIEKLWADNTVYGEKIIKNFKEHFNSDKFYLCMPDFYAIECPQFKNLGEKIRAIVEVNEDWGYRHPICKIDWLQSASQINSIEKLEGAGINIIGGLLKRAIDYGFSSLSLTSASDSVDFYKKIGFTKAIFSRYKHEYLITAQNFRNVLMQIEDKYGKFLPIRKNGN